MNRNDIIRWLRENNASRLEALWARADALRHRTVGDSVHLRGLIEISNHCARDCWYCGIRASNASVTRYRMSEGEILDCAQQATAMGYGTVVLQAGEDYGLTKDCIAFIVREIKARTPLAVTLSLGERSNEELQAWHQAGADRYLLRFETSNPALYAKIHPSLAGQPSDRFMILRHLKELGYQVGSGVMIGIPSQTYDDLAGDIEQFAALDLDMIGVGPYIPHPQTPLGRHAADESPGQVEASELMTYKVIALARLVCPHANIPSTTALATLNTAQGRELGLRRGANVVMPNLTPVQYRALYEIYPAKACIGETARQCHSCLRDRLGAIGRTAGVGPGHTQRR